MVFPKTKLNIVDNSGATVVECIKILGGFNSKKSANLGDTLVVCIKKFKFKKKLDKKKVYYAWLVNLSKMYRRKDDTRYHFSKNNCLLYLKKKNLGLELRAPLSEEIRQSKSHYRKMLSFAKLII